MLEPGLLASRSFSAADQEDFASWSGDFNPMHMDAVAARRTQAGLPVVHGIHTLLWCLDSLMRAAGSLAPVAAIRVSFDNMVYVGDTVEAILVSSNDKGFRLEARVRGLLAARVEAMSGAPKAAVPPLERDGPVLRPAIAVDLAFEDMAGGSGDVAFATKPEEIGSAFPALAREWGERRVAALACSTYLVGMVCPGLHSIFGGLVAELCEESPIADAIGFRVTKADPRFRMVRMAYTGGGLKGTIESFARRPPTAQADIAAVARLVRPGEFSGATALVVGGSRGLGEVTAKLLAAGGAKVIVTYASGKTDAERVKSEINGHGGACELMSYDVRLDPASQIGDDARGIDTLYYFSTPLIFRSKKDLFEKTRLDEFIAFYVTGFYGLCRHLSSLRPAGISAFYPSSVFASERPEGMTEYAMAKVAGEALCADMERFQRPIAITMNRLPRLATDQTASLTSVEMADPLDILPPIVRAVHAKRLVAG